MIYLKKGQTLADNPSMVVYDQTGYYNDGDSIICAAAVSPEEPAVRYEAKYIAYGGIVYSVSDPDALLEQVLKLDPNSLFGKDSKQIAVEQMVEKIVPQKSTDLSATDTPVDDTATSTPAVNNQPTTTPPEQLATSTPPVINAPNDTSTTTPSFDNNATTTPPFDLSTTTPAMDMSTTTPPIDISTTTPPIDLSTTTPPIDMSTTTPTIIDTNPATTTPAQVIPTDTNATSSEVISFAKDLVKKKISKKFGV